MKIKFNINKLFPISTAITAAAIISGQSSSDFDFEQVKAELKKKRSKLKFTNKFILDTIPVNRFNALCLLKLTENNTNFRKLYNTTININNTYSADFLLYELENQKEIEEKLGENFIICDVHRQVNSREDFELKKQLLEYGLNNPEAGQNIYFTDIIKNAESLEDALKMIEHSKTYGILPYERTNLYETCGKEVTDRMLENIKEYKNKYHLNTDYLSSYANTYREPFNIFRGGKNTLFRFDTKTGEIVSFEENNKIYNLNNKTTTTIIPKKIVKEAGLLDDELLFSAGIETRSLDGRFISGGEIKESKLDGEFEVDEITPAGRRYKLALAEIGKRGKKHVEKHFTSLDGTITDYVYISDRKGNRFTYYKITDKDNKILYETVKKFKVLAENHFQSVINGISYDIIIEKDKIKVTKQDGEQIEYKIKKYTNEDREKLAQLNIICSRDDTLRKQLADEETTLCEIAVKEGILEKYSIDKNLLETLKHLSGDEWFALKNAAVYCFILSKEHDSAYSLGQGIEVCSDLNLRAVFEHEIGHEKERALKLSKDEKLKNIYEYEKALFTTNLPDIGVKQAGYFLRNLFSDGLKETTAEVNLIINPALQWEGIGTRTLFLQQYFPKTITYIANKYNELI